MAGREPRPILGASAAVFRDGAVLLVKRGKPPGKGLWSLPGGKVEFGETLAQAALREVREETGITAELAGRAGVYEIIAAEPHFVISCYAGCWRSGEAFAGSDAAEARFIALCDIAALPLTLHVAEAIADARRIVAV